MELGNREELRVFKGEKSDEAIDVLQDEVFLLVEAKENGQVLGKTGAYIDR
jgi:hypothetical protein